VVVEPTKPLPIRSDSPPPTPTKKVSQSIPSVSTNVKEDNFTPNNTVPTSSSNVATVIATKNRGSDTLSFALFALVGLIAIPIVVLALPKRGERSDKITIIE
jgi:ABC-type dipeptide/oligopeptide/nickel transport system permease component